jgi:CO dehydrogenase maturation factor
MSTNIAISGKGGSGKTTIAAMIVRHLVERVGKSVLAVDADPNACLGLALGVEAETTCADIREQTLDHNLQTSPGMSRERAFEFAVHRAIAEATGFDLLAMGQPEGPKCYCAVNHLLRSYLDSAGQDYAYLVLDNEAGMEHLSRRTTNDVDQLIVVAEPTAVGLATARRILGLSERLPIRVERRSVLWNKVTAESAPPEANDLPVVGEVPLDGHVLDLSTRGKAVFELDAENPAFRAVGDALNELMGSTFQVESSK